MKRESCQAPTVTIAVATLLAGAFCTGPSVAQQLPSDREIQVAVGVFNAQGSDSGNISGDVSVGYFLNDPAWEIGLGQSLGYQFINGPDVWTAATTPFVNYHFLGALENEWIIPFVGLFAGAVWNDQDATGTIGPNVGLKIFLSDQAFLLARYRFEWFFDKLDVSGSNTSSDGNHVVRIGLGFVWGAEERQTSAMRHSAFVEQAERITTRAESAADRAGNAARRAEEAAKKADATAERLGHPAEPSSGSEKPKPQPDGEDSDGSGENGTP